jgi:hypothetical protein
MNLRASSQRKLMTRPACAPSGLVRMSKQNRSVAMAVPSAMEGMLALREAEATGAPAVLLVVVVVVVMVLVVAVAVPAEDKLSIAAWVTYKWYSPPQLKR